MRKFFAYEILSGYGKFKRKDTLRFVTRVGFVIFILIGLASCMALPYDQQHLEGIAPDLDVPIMGAVNMKGQQVMIEARVPWQAKWERIDNDDLYASSFPINYFNTKWYTFFDNEMQIPKKYWMEVPGKFEYMADVRARAGFFLISMKEDPVKCFGENIDDLSDWSANCPADESPTATVYARRDYHQECWDLINRLRAEEGVSPLLRYADKESCSDMDAKLNFEHHQAHYSENCVEDAKSGTQNDCGFPGPSIDDSLESCIEDDMFYAERKCYMEHPNTCNTGNPCECGHYLNIITTAKTRVSCGIYVIPDTGGKVYAIQNFWD